MNRNNHHPPSGPPGPEGYVEEEASVSTEDKDANSPIGLDVGTSRIVAARGRDKNCRYDSQLNAFITLPYSKLAENLLTREEVFHEVFDNEIVIAGNDAQQFAEVFHVETRRPMLRGVLNPREPHGVRVLRRIITQLIGKASFEGRKLFYSVPAGAVGEDLGIAYHNATIKQIVAELGYEAHPIEEGLAVVFGEMCGSNYTGIGISCGSGMCNVCLAVLSVPVVSFSVPKAGDYIDSHAAAVTGEIATRLRTEKERGFRLNGLTGDRVKNALTIYYQEVIETLAFSLRTRLSSSEKLPKFDRPVPLVLSGGTAMPKGFLDQFIAALRTQDFPVPIQEVRMSDDPLNSTARGALMAAAC
jgi:hypothetical protein